MERMLLDLLADTSFNELDNSYPGKVDQLYVDAYRGRKTAVLDGDFHVDELKALVAFMESKPA